MEIRQDIQILRGLAVTFVVLFHLETIGLSSGFLGVDVFFVVSGFLMAILYKQGEAKKFLERRAKRLLPAYFTTIIATLTASLFIVFPSELHQVTTQTIYSLLFSNNIGFWMQNSYFSKSDFNPLLHLWSLGVEIQFYLIVPLLVWFFRKSKIFLFLAFFGSISACIYMVGISPKTSFFMMPLRMWEFLIGFIVVYFLTNNGNIKYKDLSWLGCIGLVVLSIIPFVSVNGETLNRLEAHPSFYALFVCMATCLVLGFGLPKTIQNNIIGRVFSKIGDYSYSIYLVHFPIIVLYLYEPFSGTILHPESILDKSVLLILITFFAFIMHNIVEKGKFNKISLVYLLSLVSLVALMGAAKVVPRVLYTEQEQNIFNAVNDRSDYRCGKLFRITNFSSISCKLNSENFDKSILLAGNSHADSIKTEFMKVANKHQFNTYFLASNTPLIDSSVSPEMLIKEAKKYDIKHLVLHYAYNTITAEKVIETAKLAHKENIKISYILPVPTYEEIVPKIVLKTGNTTQNSKLDYINKNKEFFDKIMSYSNQNPNFKVYSVQNELCPFENSCLIADKDKQPYYFDTNHLTLSGSKLLTPVFNKILD